MGMDFFQHQDDARKNSNILVFYFVLAVIAIILSVHFATSAALFWATASAAEGEEYAFDWFNLDRLVFFAGGTLLIVLMGSLYKMWRLSDGGHSIADMLGGRPIDTNTSDPSERRVLNVVEEMAIAAGVPVPTVYLLEEEGINAFAAGTQPQDAVGGVTRGTVELLSRDELQGVIAHEFSHILNGDMRLNVRLMGVLHGILVIALIGYFVLRSSMYGGSRRPRSRRGGDPAFGAPARHHRLSRRFLRPGHQERGLAPAGISRRRLGGAVHAQPGRDWRRAQEDRWALGRLRHHESERGASEPPVFFPRQIWQSARRALRCDALRFSRHPPTAQRAHHTDRSGLEQALHRDRCELQGHARSRNEGRGRTSEWRSCSSFCHSI